MDKTLTMGMNRSRGRMETHRTETHRVPFTGSRHITSSNRCKILMGKPTDRILMGRTLTDRILMDRTLMDRTVMDSSLMRMGRTAIGSRRNR